jgi:hypothetical protein
MCLGVPCLVYATSHNQEVGLPYLPAVPLDGAGSIIGLVEDYDRRRELSAAGLALVDGHGAERAGQAITEGLPNQV